MESFECLVCRYENRLYAFVAQQLSNHLDAREVTQDTFVRAFQALRQFDTNRSFAPWLFAIARRKAIDRLRGMRQVPDFGPDETADSSGPDELLVREEERAAIWHSAKKCLPPLQYQALWLRYAEEMDVAQLAQVLRKTKIHVKVLLFRARQTLGSYLKKQQASTKTSPAQRSRGPGRGAGKWLGVSTQRLGL